MLVGTYALVHLSACGIIIQEWCNMISKTIMRKKEDVERDWYVVDVTDKILGRAATKIATLLIGKDRPDFAPHLDGGAGVIVVNCEKVKVTGKKATQKLYDSFSGYPGGLKQTPYEKMAEKKPKYIIRHAVKGMLPKNKLGAKMLARLKVYTGAEHRHTAQTPKSIEI
jgi:large subunit ribosomal protein L13